MTEEFGGTWHLPPAGFYFEELCPDSGFLLIKFLSCMRHAEQNCKHVVAVVAVVRCCQASCTHRTGRLSRDFRPTEAEAAQRLLAMIGWSQD